MLSFLLSVCIVAMAGSLVLRNTVLSGSYAKKTVSSCDLGEKKSEELKTQLVSYGNACNIGEDFFDEFFKNTLTTTFIENDLKAYYNGIFYGGNAKVDTAQLERLLKEALIKYAEENGYSDEETLEEDVELIAGEMGEIYSGVLSLPGASKISSVILKTRDYIDIVMYVSSCAVMVATFMLTFMFKPKTYSTRYLIYGWSGACLMLLAAPLYLRVTNLIGKVNIVSKALYSFVVAFGTGVLNAFIISACACAAVTAVLSLIYIRLSKKAE